ncbi:MAG: TetR family transcriptional regulator [Novosphingobium sp.]
MTSPAPTRKRGRPRLDAAPVQSGAERLLAVAIEAFGSRGFAGTSVREIAAAAQVDPALIKHQFGSKADLWHAAVDTVSARLLAELAPVQTIADQGTARAPDALAEAVAHLVDVTCDNPLIARFVLTEIAQQDARSDYVFEKLVAPIHAMLIPLVAATGSDRGDGFDADMAFLAFNGAIVTSVAARPFLARMAGQLGDDSYFKEHLRRAVLAQLLPSTGKG